MKHLTITQKLLLISVPALLVLILLSMTFILDMGSLNTQTQTSLYNELYVPASLLLNADRDFYQALEAEKEARFLKTQGTNADAVSELQGLLKDFTGKVSLELAALKDQSGTPRASEPLEGLVQEFAKNAQQEITSLQAQTVVGRQSKKLEDLVESFSKSAEQEITNLKGQQLDTSKIDALSSVVEDFSKKAESALGNLQSDMPSADAMNGLLTVFTDNAKQVQTRVGDAFAIIQKNKELFETYKHSSANITLKQLQQNFSDGYKQWYDSNPVENESADLAAHQAAFDATRNSINLMTELLDEYAEHNTVERQSTIKGITVRSVTIVAIATVLLALLAVLVISYMKKSIQYITSISKRIAQGELTLEIDKRRISRDEIGQLTGAMGQILDRLGEYKKYITEITLVLDNMKQGDMRIQLTHTYEGEFSTIKTALQGISQSLNQTLSIIATAANQVSTGSNQVASGAQALAAGSTEQASALEQLTASITKVADQAGENSGNVKSATQYVEQAVVGVNAGNVHMKQLTEAMANIGSASNQIANITKVIEDIAFQTNILALNAAIEAARAGNAGKGFAVVADEVRNLAAKSAEAAKKTADLIQHSVKTVAEGSDIAEQTARILNDVEEKANLVNASIVRIEQASADQAGAIEQIKQGLAQVSNVVQTNAATAEENSATSEQMSAQAATLNDEVAKFRLDSSYAADSNASISLLKAPPRSSRSAQKSTSSFGKY